MGPPGALRRTWPCAPVYAEGKDASVFATGLRNCAGLALQPGTGDLYCAVNERDGLGDNLPPDYVTRVREGQFFGWPWLYMGDHEDPRWKGARPDLAVMVTNPDVLLQPHSAPLAISFLDGAALPAEYRGSAFVALHGSWNRTERTGYKVVRVIMRDGGRPASTRTSLLALSSTKPAYGDARWASPRVRTARST